MLRLLSLLLLLALSLSFVLTATAPAAWADERPSAGPPGVSCDGIWYRVQPGDSWWRLARRTGLSMAALRRANPQARHPHDWLLIGERLCLPFKRAGVAQPTRGKAAPRPAAPLSVPGQPALSLSRPSLSPGWYIVQPGDSWSSLAARTGLSIRALQAANPYAARPNQWLVIGERLWIPRMPAALGRPVATPTPTYAPPSPPRLPPPRFRLPSPSPPAQPTPTPSPTPAPIEARWLCPRSVTAIETTAAAILAATAGDVEALRTHLGTCGAIGDDWGAVRQVELTGDNLPEVLVLAETLPLAQKPPQGLLVVLSQKGRQWSILYRVTTGPGLRLLGAGDLNQDGWPDIAWSETTCGVYACVTRVRILSRVAGRFTWWIEGDASMASATVTLADVTAQGQGLELVMSGGIIGTAAAGPQRAYTETWASLAGAPYTLLQRTYAPSDCLYHQILDANAALAVGREDNFAAAIAAYRRAASDPRLVACWVRENEVRELRAFALYRLAVAQAYAGDLASAEATIQELAATHPDDSYAKVADLWWAAYQPTRDAVASCAAVTVFAVKNPDTWQRLADFGFANPSFRASEVCPLLP